MEKKIPDPVDVASLKTVVIPARVLAVQVAYRLGTAQNTTKLELRI